MWPETTGKITPLYLAKRNSYFLQKFRWYAPLRPMSPDEVFDYPAEMAELASQNILGRMSKDALTMRGQALGKPVNIPNLALPEGVTIPQAPATPSTPADSVIAPADSLTTNPDITPLSVDDTPEQEQPDDTPASTPLGDTPLLKEEEENHE